MSQVRKLSAMRVTCAASARLSHTVIVCVGVMCEDGGDVEVEAGDEDLPTVDEDLGATQEGSRTDGKVVER